MKAILLVVELKWPRDQSEELVTEIERKLPGGTTRVLHSDRSIGFVIPPVDPALGAVIARAQAPLRRVANWRAFGLSGETLCQNKFMDPIEDALKDYRLARPRQALKRPNGQLVRNRPRLSLRDSR